MIKKINADFSFSMENAAGTPNGVDFDEMVTPCSFFFTSGGGTVFNNPEGVMNGWCIVLATGYRVKQIIFRFGSANTTHEIYTRTKFTTADDSWSPWAKITGTVLGGGNKCLPLSGKGGGLNVKADDINPGIVARKGVAA